jgi:hypothetical protein
MKSIKYIFGLAVIIFGMSACQDVIEVTLDDAEDLIVVDAWLNNNPEDQILKLQWSQAYFNSAFPTGIIGATVSVTRDDGVNFEFIDQGNGSYVWISTDGETLGSIGSTFDLSITNAAGKNLSSSTILRSAPPIDEIRTEFRDDDFRGEDGYYAEFFARDNPGLGDNYWIKTFKNGSYLNQPDELNIAYDAGFDAGAEVDGLIFIPPIRELINPFEDSLPPYALGDEIRVEIHSISFEAFSFFEIVRDQITNGDNTIFALPLANAKGNVVNETDEREILGMFNVADVSVAETIVQ